MKRTICIIFLFLLTIGRGFAQNTFITNLRCEYAIDPIAVDALQPRLSWNINTGERNWKQSAYRVLAASSPALLAENKGDLWDSKKVLSQGSVQVAYQGLALHSRQAVYWKVTVWDKNGTASGWSSTAQWAMGILNPEDWKADWIGRSDHAYNEFDNSLAGSYWIWDRRAGVSARLAKTFEVPALTGIKEAYLLFSVRDRYTIYLNRKLIGQSAPGDSYKKLKRIDILDQLRAGRNILAVDGGGGTGAKGIIARLMLRYRNGDSLLVATDAGWKAAGDGVKDFSTEEPDLNWPAAQVIAKYDGKPFEKLLLHPPQVDPAPYLRKRFSVSGKIVRARIYVGAPGYAELHLNGQKIGGNSERDPGFTRFDKRLLYRVYDVTGLIKAGENTIGAILGTGWYDVHDQAVWLLEKAPWRGRPRIKAELYIEYANGDKQFINSDESWKATTGPIIFDGIYTGEIYDAGKELPGWDRPGYQDASWTKAVKMPDPGGRLVSLKCPPTGIDSTIVPIGITEPRTGVYVVDMGQNFSGHTQLRVRAPKGTRITMRYAEVLNDKGLPETGNIESFMAPSTPRQPFQTDTYICKGAGLEVWEQRFSYSGFRYVEVTGLPFKPTADNFRGRFAHTLLETDGRLETSDTLINKIQKIVQWGYLSNAQNIPTDCPQREKNGWTGDAHLAAETGIMNYNTAAFYSKWLDDQADAQLPGGLIPVIVPSADWGLHWEPEWNCAYHLIAWYLYRYYGDKQILQKHYSQLKLYLDSLNARRKDGLLAGSGYGDWDPYAVTTSKKLTANAYLYATADMMANTAGVLELPADSARFRMIAEDVKVNFNKAFLNPVTGVYENGSQCAMSLPLQFNMVPAELREKVEGNLAASVRTEPHIDAGILGTKNILRALSAMGHTDLAYQMVDRRENPGWGYWITQGATTTWGGWGKAGKKNLGSLNHIMFGDVSAWLFNNIAGIAPDPAAPGFTHFFIQPGLEDNLQWVKCSYRSIQGMITVSWRKSAGNITLDVDVPANTSASVVLPAAPLNRVRESNRGLQEANGILSAKQAGDHVRIEVGSGSYHFSINN